MASNVRIEAAIRAGCDGGLPPGGCVYPDCNCRLPLRIKAALTAADRPMLGVIDAAKQLRDLDRASDPNTDVWNAAFDALTAALDKLESAP